MKIKKNGVTINLTESDLKIIVKEQSSMIKSFDYKSKIKTAGFTTEQEDVINDIYDKLSMLFKYHVKDPFK